LKRSKNIKLSKAKADKYFSEYIRLRDNNKPCVTCGKYTDLKDCGHFISRRFESVRFDEKNAHGQCQKCNRFEYGNQFEHGVKVDEMYGKGTAETLLIKSKMFCKRDQYDYEQIALLYKTKIDEILKD
jgi:hypothetical protein